jgi:NAD-dependent deacetylase
MDVATMRAAAAAALDCDLFVAIGTSLTVQPAAGLVDIARSAGAPIVIVNARPTPYDDVADAVIREPIGQVVPALISAALAVSAQGRALPD